MTGVGIQRESKGGIESGSSRSCGMRDAEKEAEASPRPVYLRYIVARLISRIPGRSSFEAEKDGKRMREAYVSRLMSRERKKRHQLCLQREEMESCLSATRLCALFAQICYKFRIKTWDKIVKYNLAPLTQIEQVNLNYFLINNCFIKFSSKEIMFSLLGLLKLFVI